MATQTVRLLQHSIPMYLLIGASILLAVAFICIAVGRKRTVPDKLQRSDDYRYRYFKSHRGLFGKGIYICPYCGKLMKNKSKIQIDHIYSVHRVQNSPFLRKVFLSTSRGVNNMRNLTHSCVKCNKRKGSKGGIWVFLGFFGEYIMFPCRLAAYAGVIYFVSSYVHMYAASHL